MKTLVFTKPHNYGGLQYEVDQKVIVPDDRAAMLLAVGVCEVEEIETKEKKRGRGKARPKNND